MPSGPSYPQGPRCVFDNRRWLIAAAGEVSSFGKLKGLITNPLQVGERLSDGSIRWLANRGNAQSSIQGQPVNTLETSGDVVVIGSDQGLYVSSINTAGELGAVKAVTTANGKITSLAKGASGRLFAASPNRGIFTATAAALQQDPATAWRYVPGSNGWVEGKTTVKLATSSDPSTGQDVLYVGTGGKVAGGYKDYDAYDFIHRILFSNDQVTPLSHQTADVFGKIGTGQVDIHSSFAADPTTANRVLAGGNWMTSGWQANKPGSTTDGDWIPATPGASTGGVVGTIFDSTGVRFENHFPSVQEPLNAAGTAPHADSRDITFLTTRNGSTRIIESDDGGIFSKDIAINAPWQDLNVGLRTTEGFSSDWSNIGKLAITAMQDNAAALGQYRANSKEFYNITGGDGSIARFDDGSKGSNELSRAYYGSQQYSGNGVLQTSTHSKDGLLQHTDILTIDVADRYGNFQSFLDYDINWSGGISKYPFNQPVATNPYRAGDLVIAGLRNIYEAIVPHWQLETAGVAKFVPLLEDSSNGNKDRIRKFTEIALGSQQGSRFSTDKPHSWDTLYTSFATQDAANNTFKTHFYGRKAQESKGNWFEHSDAYRLKDLTAYLPKIATDQLITGITFNPQNPDQIWLAISDNTITYGQQISINANTLFNSLSTIIHSADGGKNWRTVGQSGKNGIPATASLQQIIYAPANDKGSPAELFIGGYGGVWRAPVGSNRKPLTFESVRWDNNGPDANFNLWNTDLEYDPQDDVVIASIMGQGTWLLNRSQKPLSPSESIAPGLRISELILPQDINNYKTRKGRSVYGTMEVSLERDQSNQDQDVSVDLEFSPDWQDYIEVVNNNQPLFSGIKDNRITLWFPKGVDKLTFYVSTKLYLNRPDRKVSLTLKDAKNAPIADGNGSVYLYATGDTIYLLQEEPGVFYSNRDSYFKPPTGDPLVHQAQKLAILMPRASLSPGQQLFWYPVNSNGDVTISNPDGSTRLISPKDASYLEAVKQLLRPLAATTLPRDPRAFNPQKAAQAFTNPQAVLESEGVAIGEVATSLRTPFDESLPWAQGRFAFALSDASGAVLVSPHGFSLDGDASLDNTVNFGAGASGNQVVLAPALGELFVVDDIYASENNPVIDGKLKFNLNVANFGQQSGYGLFRVDDPYGNFYFVNGVFQGTLDKVTPLTPGSLAYAQEAIRRSFSNSLDGVTGLPLPAYGTSAKAAIDLAVGNAYGIYITPNQVLNPNSPVQDLSTLRFSIMGANANQSLQHVSMGTGYFSFEESLVGSASNDNDFNDLQFLIAPVSPDTILT